MKYPGMASITETLKPPAIAEEKDSMKIFYFTTLIFSAAVVLGRKTGNEIDSLDYEPDIEPYESLSSTEKPIFKYRKNGIKLDLKIVPNSRNDTILEDEFPNFPANDIGVCVLDLSLTCVQRRIHNFLDKIRNLKEITLLGNWIKLVRTREPAEIITERRFSDSRDGLTDLISRDIDTFFDIFALRINLPSIQGKRKKNQIDIMFDENGLVEGRGKSGKGGKGGGGKCKKMMMMMLMMVKMKMMGMMGMTAMKSMMMAGMSLMISKWMLIQKLMDAKKGGGGGGGGGPWQGGGGGGGGPWQGGGGGAPLKEIVLLTKASGGGGGGGGGGGCCGGGSGGSGSGGPSDSYGAPPPSSNYGSPAGGGYDSGGGGGWGRSFDVYEPQSLNFIPQIVEQPSSRYERTATVGAVPVYENASPVYKSDDNRDIGTSSDTAAPYNDQSSKNTSNDRTNDVAPSAPQSQFVTLRSGYKIFPVKDTSDLQAQGAVENPIYVNDWKNFELAKQWTSNRQSSITSDHGAEHSSQDSFEKNNDHDYLQSHYPYRGLQVMDRNVVLQGV